jgi:signal transducing adaptor molecule
VYHWLYLLIWIVLGVSFEDQPESPQGPTDEQLKREEEEIQKAIEASQREQWGGGGYKLNDYVLPTSQAPIQKAQEARKPDPSQGAPYAAPAPQQASGLYQPYPSASASTSTAPATATAAAAPATTPAQQAVGKTEAQSSTPTTGLVRALYDFDPQEEGELLLRKGDIIRVIDSVYTGWWRGERAGQVGIFPVNYVVSF